jgi:hypothetical protein
MLFLARAPAEASRLEIIKAFLPGYFKKLKVIQRKKGIKITNRKKEESNILQNWTRLMKIMNSSGC